MKRYQDFLDYVRKEDSYESPADRRKALFPALKIYGRLARETVSCYRRVGSAEAMESIRESSFNVLRSCEEAGAKIKIEGLNHLHAIKDAKPGPVILANHMSLMETCTLYCMLADFENISVVLKESLMNYPVFGKVLTGLQPLVVTRTDPKKDFKTVMDEGLDRLKRGFAVVIFPQGTRRLEVEPDQFTSLGARLASKAKAPVVPLALKTNFWGNGKYLKDFGPIDTNQSVHYCFGPAREIANVKKDHKELVEFICAKVAEWQ